MDAQDLKKAGLAATLPRLKILKLLEENLQRHMSAEDIYKVLMNTGENVSVATIYRVLHQFCEAGIVQRLNLENGHAVYELERGDHHDHMCCMKCGKISEFFDEAIEKRQKVIAEKAGWAITEHTMILFGICPKCQ